MNSISGEESSLSVDGDGALPLSHEEDMPLQQAADFLPSEQTRFSGFIPSLETQKHLAYQASDSYFGENLRDDFLLCDEFKIYDENSNGGFLGNNFCSYSEQEMIIPSFTDLNQPYYN